MWCTKRRLNPYKSVIKNVTVSARDLHVSEFLTSTPVNRFVFQKRTVNGKESTVLSSDIYMLFNQQRLDKMSLQTLVEYFNSISVSNSQLSDLRSKLSDDQLFRFIKSRFIQSPSELLSWSEYLMTCQDEFKAATVLPGPPVDPLSPTGAAPAVDTND